MGTIGLLLKAKQAQVIAKVAPILDELDKVDFRISPALRHQALVLAEELDVMGMG
ncbi:MAG: DUF3368 domain-containing protein [Acaryochloridaceae cyanobacterium RL_2_7]|nr:DUF3368 domain-containing protein [Acaryochloridaceae cyanobacterium RL_2_7]